MHHIKSEPNTVIYSKLAPELLVTDLRASLRFWVDLLGFANAYERPEEHFFYLDRVGVQVMLEQYGK
jgi:catechol 2,3-dioxygenase-like lactoylglutathione lyase family enzyme